MNMMEDRFLNKLNTTKQLADLERRNFSTINATSLFASNGD